MIQLDSGADYEAGINSTATLSNDLKQLNQWQCVLTRSSLVYAVVCYGRWCRTVGVVAVHTKMNRRVVSGDSLTAFLIFLKKRVKSCRGLILVTKKATTHWSGRCWLGKKSWQQMFKFYIGFMLSGCQQVDHLPCRTENKLREMEFTQKLQFCWDLLTLNLFLLPAWPFFQETNTDIYFNTSWWFVSKFELLFIFFINTFIQQEWIQLIKSDNKYIECYQKISIIKKTLFSKLSIPQRIIQKIKNK